MDEKENTKKSFSTDLLSDVEKAQFTFVQNRILELRKGRQNHYGINIEKIWEDADRDYVPHRLKTTGKKVVASDDDKGWRGTTVTLGANDWQSDISQTNPFVKISIALSILVDRNPTGVFTPLLKKFQATTVLMSQLYQRSWEIAKSKQQLKLFILNLTKYGWAIARTYPLKITRTVKELTEYNPDEPDKSKYETKRVTIYNDIMRENLDPWNTWIDDMAKSNNQFSIRDWCWRKVYSMDTAKEEFGNYKFWEYVQVGGVITERVDVKTQREFQDKNLVEVYFYENVVKDLFMVIIGGVPVIIEPLPISDSQGHKKLSCWQTYWNLRNSQSPYGIGIYEAIRYENAMLDRIRNMTIDQLTLSIYKMWFYQGTQALTDTGDIKIVPGVGKQTIDPKNISWLQVPGPGVEAWKGIEMFQDMVNQASGIVNPLTGEITGKTAFEVAQAKEAALGRLKFPLDNICDALETEAYITISLIQLIYSIPEMIRVTDDRLIEDYLREIKSDPQLYERKYNEENGLDEFYVKLYPEFPLNLEENEEGNLIETEKTQFFRIKPKFLEWEGIINVKPQSVLTPSKQLDKALDLEMYNVVLPLIGNTSQEISLMKQTGAPVEFNELVYGKVLKNIIKLYDKDPRDILPDSWLSSKLSEAPLFVPQQQNINPQILQQGQQPLQAEKMVSSVQNPTNPQSLIQKLVSRLSAPFRKV